MSKQDKFKRELTKGSRLNQKLSFSPLFAKSTTGAKVFWPGCALLKLDPTLIDTTYTTLRQAIPDLGFNTYCCGKPSLHVNTKKIFNKRIKWLNHKIKKNGIKEAYVACPNCKAMLEQYTNLKVTTIWEVLDKSFPAELINIAQAEPWALHDPCPSRADSISQKAVRSILTKAGVTIQEFPHNKKRTQCCGNLDMLMVLDPPKGKAMLKKRLAEAPDAPITSYCEGCVKAFNKNGKRSRHILELLFGESSSSNSSNRYKNAHKKR